MDVPRKDRFWHRLPWPRGRTGSRSVLVEVGTIVALTATLLAITFLLRDWARQRGSSSCRSRCWPARSAVPGTVGCWHWSSR